MYWNTSGTASTTDIWQTWTTHTAGADSTITYVPWVEWNVKYEETAKQRRARLKQEREQRAEWERRRIAAEERDAQLRAEQEAAVATAEKLLREHLAEEQVAEYDRLKAFLVKAQSGRTYRIKKGWAGNVELLNDEGQPIMRFCIHPRESVPEQDNMLAQKFLLENDEESFERIANKTPIGVR
jgi:hypothetical protein